MRRAVALSILSAAIAGLFVYMAPSAGAQETGSSEGGGTATPPPSDFVLTGPDRAAEDSRTPEERTRRAQVVARIGDVSITVGEVEDEVNEQSPFMRARFRDPAHLREFVDNMIRFELLAREAGRQGVGDQREVREGLMQSAVQQMIRHGLDERLTVESIPQADVDAYFAAHPDEFSRPEVRRASHILCSTREECEGLLEQARTADARQFRELAQEHSVDSETRMRGGDLRYFDAEGQRPNTADPAVDGAIVRAVFALSEVGAVAPELVQVGDRFSLVKLTGIRPAEQRQVGDAAPTIRLRLWRERRQAAIESVVARLRERFPTEVFYDRMRNIRMDPPERLTDEDSHGAAAVDEASAEEQEGSEVLSPDQLLAPPEPESIRAPE